MNKLPDISAPTPASATRNQTVISPARKSSNAWPAGSAGIARLAVLIAALAVSFSLNALAADTPGLTGAQSAVTPGVDAEQREQMRAHWEKMSPEERKQIRARIQEHWKSMTPEQREEQRKEMRENFDKMSPQERQQFKSDMDMIDGMPPQGSDYPAHKSVSAGSSTKG